MVEVGGEEFGESVRAMAVVEMADGGNALQIFCRLRPLQTEHLGEDAEMDGEIVKKNGQVLALRKSGSCIEQQYMFEQVFDSGADQREVFEVTCLPVLHSLFQGKDSLIFAYGVTSSGKSFTINGSSENPGIIPRSIDYIFTQLSPELLLLEYNLVPLNGDQYSVSIANEQVHFDPVQHVANKRKYLTTVADWAKRTRTIRSRSSNLILHNRRFAIFITFVEVYNNYVYDLLDHSRGQNLKPKRNPLDIRKDSKGSVFVVGASEVQVFDANEAIKLFLFGLQNRQMAETLLNQQSSRSHSVFTLKLVYCFEEGLENLSPAKLKVSRISFTDLAGMERTKRTKNTGFKLAEAGKINFSLLSLRNCFEAIRVNQRLKKNMPIPYRQSKLTRLFETAFELRSQIRMIVCLKPHVDDSDENGQVLSFGKKMQEIVIEEVQRPVERVAPDDCSSVAQTSSFIDFGQLTLSRFKMPGGEHDSIGGDQFMAELEQFCRDHANNIKVIIQASNTILQRLDEEWKSFPEKVSNQKILNSIPYTKLFKVLQKYQSEMKKVNRRSVVTIGNIANTPLVFPIKHGKRSVIATVIQEMSRDIQNWEIQTLENMALFKSSVQDAFDFFATHCGQCSESNPKKMDVFNRLYNQTPARLKCLTVKVSSMARSWMTKTQPKSAAKPPAKSAKNRFPDYRRLYCQSRNQKPIPKSRPNSAKVSTTTTTTTSLPNRRLFQ